MSEFEESEWKNQESVANFVQNSESYLLERKRIFEVMRSFYNYFLKNNQKSAVKAIDLGCGDGKITEELLKLDPKMKVILIDGSSEMLKHAQERLKSFNNLEYLQKTFQELISENKPFSGIKLVVSSLAIHHLTLKEKEDLYRFIYNTLSKGGFFLNIDVVASPSAPLEDWYLKLWEEWILQKEKKMNNKYNHSNEKASADEKLPESFSFIPVKYKNNPDNLPDSLETQLDMLKTIGFQNVDCYYKYGIFSVFGGAKY
jgi:tRNA (cmo5U34)-methyltransferase